MKLKKLLINGGRTREKLPKERKKNRLPVETNIVRRRCLDGGMQLTNIFISQPPSARVSTSSIGTVPGTVPSPPPSPRRPLLPPLPLLQVSRWRGRLPPMSRRDDLRSPHRRRPLPLRLPRERLLRRFHSGVRKHAVASVCASFLCLVFVFVLKSCPVIGVE